ncbi:MAG: glycosyltransferase [Oligoflexales bacterium]
MKVAIVHDWLISYRGGEKVLEAIASLFPEAPIYTLFYDPRRMPNSINERCIKYPKSLNILSPIRKALLPILPAMIESLKLWDFDLIISTSSCVAKGVIPGPYAKHVCYLHSPMRYIWDQQEEYLSQFEQVPGIKSVVRFASVKLRLWDTVSSSRVDKFLVNSSFVANRVGRYYGRQSKILHPPINIDFFQASDDQAKGGYFLAAGALVHYKRFDLAIHACERLGKKLVIAGKGEMEKKLRRIAGRYTKFEIAPDDNKWKKLLQQAEGLIFPGVEDFGMIAIEAMACGTPVIAYENGGALDFIKPGITGTFFTEQSVEALTGAIENFKASDFNQGKIVEFAGRFNQERFKQDFFKEIEHTLKREVEKIE